MKSKIKNEISHYVRNDKLGRIDNFVRNDTFGRKDKNLIIEIQAIYLGRIVCVQAQIKNEISPFGRDDNFGPKDTLGRNDTFNHKDNFGCNDENSS